MAVKPQPIIPMQLILVRTFTCREEWHFRKDVQEWVRSDASDPPLHDQVNAWVRQERVQIVGYSPPSVNPVEDSDESRLYYVAATFSFAEPVSGARDAG